MYCTSMAHVSSFIYLLAVPYRFWQVIFSLATRRNKAFRLVRYPLLYGEATATLSILLLYVLACLEVIGDKDFEIRA